MTVAFNPGEELERFLASLATATARRLVVVIADNGTEHDVVTAAAQRHGARVVGDGTNLGYGAGANLAAADLEEDWIVVANPDLVWRPGSLDVLIDAGLANPAAGCLGPLLLNPDGTVYPSGRAFQLAPCSWMTTESFTCTLSQPARPTRSPKSTSSKNMK